MPRPRSTETKSDGASRVGRTLAPALLSSQGTSSMQVQIETSALMFPAEERTTKKEK